MNMLLKIMSFIGTVVIACQVMPCVWAEPGTPKKQNDQSISGQDDKIIAAVYFPLEGSAISMKFDKQSCISVLNFMFPDHIFVYEGIILKTSQTFESYGIKNDCSIIAMMEKNVDNCEKRSWVCENCTGPDLRNAITKLISMENEKSRLYDLRIKDNIKKENVKFKKLEMEQQDDEEGISSIPFLLGNDYFIQWDYMQEISSVNNKKFKTILPSNSDEPSSNPLPVCY